MTVPTTIPTEYKGYKIGYVAGSSGKKNCGMQKSLYLGTGLKIRGNKIIRPIKIVAYRGVTLVGRENAVKQLKLHIDQLTNA